MNTTGDRLRSHRLAHGHPAGASINVYILEGRDCEAPSYSTLSRLEQFFLYFFRSANVYATLLHQACALNGSRSLVKQKIAAPVGRGGSSATTCAAPIGCPR